ncbi:phosphatase PAP2 family protein [Tenacibaculum sp. 190524A02b]|uniref:Lipid A 4'-phosphatase n=1 Tax=Tenacibaculum vairaonense TaxID=3137860 RepID=A0ABM9PQC7_9FLAO
MRLLGLLLFFVVFNSCITFSQKSFIESSGDILQIGIPAIALGSTFFLKQSDKPHWQFAKAMGTSFVITHSLKRILNKKRPNGGNHAFPSGHTSAAFTGAAFIHKRYGWKYGIPAYLLASYVGYSRIYADKHDIYDVIAGAGLGIISSFIFTKSYLENRKITFGGTFTKNRILISFNYHL